jgi:hypothetical protein
MFKPTYLYIKTHNKTGLKYFGKTISKDPHKYQGSGTRWKNHIKTHGYDVSTEIVGYFIDEEECRQKAIEFGKENNIVESAEWANLKEESLEGGWDHITNNKEKYRQQNLENGIKTKELKIGIFSLSYEEHCENLKIAREKQKEIFGANSVFSILNTQKEFIEKKKEIFKKIEHQQGSRNSQFGTMWIYNEELKQNKKILKSDLIPEGWSKGRKMNFK